MTKEHKAIKLIGQTDKSVIAVTDTYIKIVQKNSNNSINPLGVVTIIPGVQLELGREMKEFIACLRLVRKPLAIQKIAANNNGQCTWHVIRLSTGNVPEAKVCTINTINEIIAAVSFNQELAYNLAYRKLQKLSIIHQLTVGKVGLAGILSKAVTLVATITGEPVSNFKITEGLKSITVYTSIKELKMQYRFTFFKDKKDYYNLLSVAFLEKRS